MIEIEVLLVLCCVDFSKMQDIHVLVDEESDCRLTLPSLPLHGEKNAVEVAKDILVRFANIDRNWLELVNAGYYDDPNRLEYDKRTLSLVFGSFIPAQTELRRGKWVHIGRTQTLEMAADHALIVRNTAAKISGSSYLSSAARRG